MPEIKIFDALPEEEILAQMAEECVEASKAALKLRRVRSGVNPTPVSEKDAFENLVEELADVYLLELCSVFLQLVFFIPFYLIWRKDCKEIGKENLAVSLKDRFIAWCLWFPFWLFPILILDS